ncbi:unnamed protein product [Fasciola hepatica]|uniref:Uncharacterized protein n=1 Tax=Fasciola hepatica TaxID=6192 RepID=A0ABC9HI89_FASHE
MLTFLLITVLATSRDVDVKRISGGIEHFKQILSILRAGSPTTESLRWLQEYVTYLPQLTTTQQPYVVANRVEKDISQMDLQL